MVTGGTKRYETEIYHFSNSSWTFKAQSFLPHERSYSPSLAFEDSVLLVNLLDSIFFKIVFSKILILGGWL